MLLISVVEPSQLNSLGTGGVLALGLTFRVSRRAGSGMSAGLQALRFFSPYPGFPALVD